MDGETVKKRKIS